MTKLIPFYDAIDKLIKSLESFNDKSEEERIAKIAQVVSKIQCTTRLIF